MINIDLDETYTPVEIAQDFSFMMFSSPQWGESASVFIKVEIRSLENNLLPEVYNLSFGAVGQAGHIDDSVRLHHKDLKKVFSTILLVALTFLRSNERRIIGFDGSDDVRAYLYHRMFTTNKENMKQYLILFGVDWYVRLLRNLNIEVDASGAPLFKPRPESFDCKRPVTDLYMYYMFRLK